VTKLANGAASSRTDPRLIDDTINPIGIEMRGATGPEASNHDAGSEKRGFCVFSTILAPAERSRRILDIVAGFPVHRTKSCI
jgi:hypothetical protein